MNPRYRIFVILAVLLLVSLGYYYISNDHSSDLVLQGTVDANQVIVSSQILGRIKKLAVEEGQDVKAGDLIAILDQDELSAAKAASEAQAESAKSQLGAMKATAESTSGDTENAFASAQATYSAAVAAHRNQELLTQRIVALAEKGILSAQDRDTAVQSLKASQDQMTAAEAAMKAAKARTNQAKAARENVASTQGQWASIQAQANEARTRLGYTRILAPVDGKIGIWAAREGEVVNPGSAIVTLVNLHQTWVYAPIPETEADAVQIGDPLKVRMPSGALVDGKVIVKSAEGDFATQRDVSHRKRDIKTIRIKLLISNPEERYVPGMTAEVLVPKRKLVHS